MANAVSLIKGTVGQQAPLGFSKNAVELHLGETMPDIIVGTGAVAGDAEPFLSANKGSVYFRADNTDDNSCIYVKIDEAGEDADWGTVLIAVAGIDETDGGMNADPESDAENGFVTVYAGAAGYEIPLYDVA